MNKVNEIKMSLTQFKEHFKEEVEHAISVKYTEIKQLKSKMWAHEKDRNDAQEKAFTLKCQCDNLERDLERARHTNAEGQPVERPALTPDEESILADHKRYEELVRIRSHTPGFEDLKLLPQDDLIAKYISLDEKTKEELAALKAKHDDQHCKRWEAENGLKEAKELVEGAPAPWHACARCDGPFGRR